jgi:phage tail protein X
MNEVIEVRGEGIALDLLLWRRFGRPGLALVEKTLDMNSGIARGGAFLPLGAKVALPVPPAALPFATTAVSLFD